MKSKIKILIWILLAMTLNLNALSEAEVKANIKKYMEKRLDTPVKSIEVVSSYPLEEEPDWYVYFLTMRVTVKSKDKTQDMLVNQPVFSNGKKITLKLMKRGKYGKKDRDYAKLLKPKVPDDAYDDAHLLVGSKDAPHKIVLFSDPFCPYCQEKFPEILELVKKNPKTYALYYYHLPLVKIHPASDLTTRAMHLFQKRGELDKMALLYDLPIEATEKDSQKILHAITQKTGVTFTLDELESEEVNASMRADALMKRRLLVTSTPTIFLDGTWDRLRREYDKYAQ